MLVVGIIFLLFTGLFGLIILSAIFKNKTTPKPAVLIHGTLAVLSLLVLAGYIAAEHYSNLLIASLIIFLLAGLGGVTMLTIDLKGKAIPKVIAVLHPLAALLGIGLLIFYFLQT